MEYRLYIDGQFKDPAAGGTIGVRAPALGKEFTTVAYGTREDARLAVEAAVAAFPAWRKTNVYERAGYINRIADLMRERADSIGEALTRENGKPLAESKGEVMGAAATLDWSAEVARHHYGQWIASHTNDKRLLTLRSPIGVTAAIAPWNFPVMLICRKLGPALAVGCTVVCRAASQTPRSVMELFNCVHDSGLPAGAANLITGSPSEQSDEFLENSEVKKISFTGSVEVGKTIMKKAAGQLKKLSLELGGHSPFIVCEDADIKRAADVAVKGKFRNMGQSCIAPSRFFVPTSMADEFTEEVVRLASALKLGNGMDADTEVGPLIDDMRLAATEAIVDDVIKNGGKVLCGGKRPPGDACSGGSFYEPTVVSGVTDDMLIMKEEPFAPVLPIIPYDDLDEAVARANDVPYGLAAYMVTNDMRTMFKLGEELDSGVIAVNDFAPAAPQAPFGGTKESGLGREGSWQVLEAYTETKFMSIVL